MKGTGLIDVLFGTDQFEPESEGMDIGEDMWVDVDKNEFEMPTIKGTKEQQLQFAALVKYGWRTLVRRTGLKTRRRPPARRLCTIAEN